MDIKSTTWTEGDDFIAFAFGNFDSKAKGIIRTSDGNRYNGNLSPQLQDKTADIPGADGQFYFGTQHKTQSFTINFAFERLSVTDIRDLKKAFSGKDLKELIFSESVTYDTEGKPDTWKIYMAKVTSQPTIKYLTFDENGVEVYKGEGSVQFTAYWPYCRDNTQTPKGNKTATADEQTETVITDIDNIGDIPTHFVFSSTVDGISKIQWEDDKDQVLCTIEGTNIRTWDSKTGIIKDSSNIISYTGDGLFNIPVGTDYKIIITHSAQKPIKNTFTIQYYNWYY